MTTNNHPAHGPVSLDRLHQISEILSKASAQSYGGNIGYAMADAVKVIDGAIESAGMEPYGYVHKDIYESCGTAGLSNGRDAYSNSDTHIALYTAPPAPVVKLPNEFISSDGIVVQIEKLMGVLAVHGIQYERRGNAFRTTMLQSLGNSEQLDEVGSWNNHMNTPTDQAGNSPVTPDGYVLVPKDLLSELRDWAHPEIEKYCDMWEGRRDSEFPALRKVIADADALLAAATPGKWIPVSERMPDQYVEVIVCTDAGSRHIAALNRQMNWDDGDFLDDIQNVTHWMPLPAPPQ